MFAFILNYYVAFIENASSELETLARNVSATRFVTIPGDRKTIRPVVGSVLGLHVVKFWYELRKCSVLKDYNPSLI